MFTFCVDISSKFERELFTFTFSKTDISLSVNKVGKTLLLDEFDVQSVLSHAAQVNYKLVCLEGIGQPGTIIVI